MIFGKPPDHLIKVATLIKDFWRLWVQQRSMTYVCKCMRTYSSVAWRMYASAWERTAA